MQDRAPRLQDLFLNHVRKNKTPLTVFLVSGVKLQGIVTWFDKFGVLLKRDRLVQLVYKHPISTIMPDRPVRLDLQSYANGLELRGRTGAGAEGARQRSRPTAPLTLVMWKSETRS